LGGNYKIPVSNGDTLIFSSAGYLADTLIVDPTLDFEDYTVYLNPNIIYLPFVVINEEGKYQLDSVNRRNEYNFLYGRKHPVKLWNEKRQEDGPGLSFSPIGYYSSNQVQQRRLKKRLAEEEEGYYIDYKFSVSRVAQLTRLKGDTLQLFMRKFRPSYQFCRTANAQDILFYVNEKFKLFKSNEFRR
jgi:hypothetical protein